MTTNRFASLILTLSLAGNATAHDEATARYLGNEGVLVTHGDQKVLFDAFYADSYGTYLLVDDETTDALLAGEPPFDGVDALFVSHVHGDHFSPQPTVAYLEAHPAVSLYASAQVAEALAEQVGADSPLLDRVRVMDVAPGEAALELVVGDLSIDVVAVPHAGGDRTAQIRNLAFRVTLEEEVTVVHLGDADPDPQHFDATHWQSKGIDVAFPPYWFFASDAGRLIVDDLLKARHAVGIHVPAEALGNGDAWRRQLGRDVFTDPGEQRQIEHP